MASGILNVAHPIMQFNVLHSKKPLGSNAKQGSTCIDLYEELFLHVIQVFGLNITMDHSNTISIGFVLMISIIASMEQHENLQFLSLFFQLYGPSKKVLT
jgi:hypothetical protein